MTVDERGIFCGLTFHELLVILILKAIKYFN